MAASGQAFAQQEATSGATDAGSGVLLEVRPRSLKLEVGEQAKVEATVKDASGRTLDTRVVFFSRQRQSLTVNARGEVEALRPGTHTLIALVPKHPGDDPRRAEAHLRQEISVEVPLPPVESIAFEALSSRLFRGTTVPLTLDVIDRTGVHRLDVAARFWSSNEAVARVDRFGQLDLLDVGATVVHAEVEDLETKIEIRVQANPIRSISIEADVEAARTGDAVRFEATALDENGTAVAAAPIRYTLGGSVDPAVVAPGAAAMIDAEGYFVAERSGLYVVVATIGSRSASKTISVRPRAVSQEFEVVGHGAVRDRHTSDFWVWHGAAGRDYAITGTWGAGGHAYIWDVTDPSSMSVVDTVKVDARTVNDVKVSVDGRLAVISREGASNRKNGIVLLDVSEPEIGVRILSSYDDQLSGGVHNLYIYENHVYTINNSRRFDVINVDDPREPYRVGRFQIDSPGRSMHDVVVVDGVAFTSNWKDGVIAVDVGGGGIGGSPKRPKELGRYAYPNGWNHTALPYRSPSTGKFYVFAGDEAFPYSRLGTGKNAAPNRAAGWIHIIEWEDWDSPREVARYQVPEAGSHNFWIEDEILYAAFYNAGLRAVDISGVLRGDLYRQGREIAFWVPLDPDGFVANAAFTWGAQVHDGAIFVADWNSGLWAVNLVERSKRGKVIGEPQ